MLPPLLPCRRALVVAAAAAIAMPRSRAGAESTAGLRLDGESLQRAQQQLYAPLPEVPHSHKTPQHITSTSDHTSWPEKSKSTPQV